LKLQIGASTDVGRIRDHNEDTFMLRDVLGLFVVADGMGGHQAGEVASAMAALSMGNYFEATVEGPVPDEFAMPEDGELADAARRLACAVRKANADVWAVGSTHDVHRGMGSTVVAAHLDPSGKQIHIAHVGDSRAYRVRDSGIDQLTRDHSLAAELAALDPTMTEEDLKHLPSNIITRALGIAPTVNVDMCTVDLERGDTLLLCSDGLNGMLSDKIILEAVRLSGEADDAPEVLVALANEAGGEDNVTALVLKF
jgi:protein phosphatase